MTIDEAIALVKIERECVIRADVCDRNCEKCDLVQDSGKLIDMYEQLAEWLEELKSYRASVFSGYMTQKMLKEEYNKAIDDLIAECENAKFAESDEISLSDIHTGVNSGLSMAIHFAEQLKAGESE